jgi:hypothetical protein
MSPTLQNTRAQRNAVLARSSSSTGHVVNVRYWHKAESLCHGIHRSSNGQYSILGLDAL